MTSVPSESWLWKWNPSSAPPEPYSSADDRVPVGAVRVDAPDAPRDTAVNALRFERTEYDAAVLQYGRVQGAADVDVPDLLDVRAVVVHREELVRHARVAAWHLHLVAGAGERDAPARQRARAEVEHAATDRRVRLNLLALRERLATSVRRGFLVRELHELLRLHVNLVDVRPGAEVAEIEPRIVDPPPSNETYGSAIDPPAFDQHLLRAVGVEQHEVSPRRCSSGARSPATRTASAAVLHHVSRANVDDVVIDLHRLVRRERLGTGSIFARAGPGRARGERTAATAAARAEQSLQQAP